MADENIWKFIDESDLSGFCLIIPSVAVGNVAQLTCDLLISSLNMKKIASVYSSALIPVLGYNAFDLNSHDLSTSCDLYKCIERKILILQMRAPPVIRYARDFLQEVVKKFKEKNITDIIILTSSFASEMRHVLSSPFRFLANDLSVRKDQAKSLNWREFEISTGTLKIYGGGFATLLYTICKENSMPCFMLFKYCSEGDNSQDAYTMVEHLAGLLSLFDNTVDLQLQLKPPPTWAFLFGRPPPQEIY